MPRSNPIEIDNFSDLELVKARKLVEEEFAVFVKEGGGEGGGGKFEAMLQQAGEIFDETMKPLLFLPTRGVAGGEYGVPQSKVEVRRMSFFLSLF